MRKYSLTAVLPAAISCLLIAFGTSEARIVNVPEDQQSIQSGIRATEDGDTVLVQPGLYSESISFDGHRIIVSSLILVTDDPAYIDSTIIDGSQEHPCVVFRNEETSESKLRGFTLQNGRQAYGGGIDIRSGASPELIDLHITHNYVDNAGGGIHCSINTRPIIKNCVIDQNEASLYGGGGISLFDGAFPTIIDCQITDNVSEFGKGGGLWLWDSKAEIVRCEIARNEAIESGGIWVEQSDTLIIRDSNIHDNRVNGEDCVIGGLRVDGGNIRGGKTHLILEHTIIANNVAPENGAFLIQESEGRLSNLTVVNNESGQLRSGIIKFCNLLISNSIFYSNQNPFVLAENRNETILDYCDIEDTIRGFVGDVTWGDNNISTDPLFIDAGNQNYGLTPNSPCINTGDPDSPREIDGTRSDIGAISSINYLGLVSGRVVDGRTNEPLPRLVVTSDDGRIVFGDNSGVWHFPVFAREDSAVVNLDLAVEGYSRHFIDTVVYLGDSLWIDLPFFQSRFIPSIDEIICEVDSNSFLRMTLRISNDQPGVLNWTGTTRTMGSAGLPPVSLRDSLQIAQLTDDERIEGATFDGERFYISGANGNDDNLIYVLDREGALLDSFPQVGSSRYGYKDIDFDGEHLWAIDEDSVYCLTIEGEVVERWPYMINPNWYIAYDRVDNIVWLSGSTSQIYGFDPHGNNLGRVLASPRLHIYGLGCADYDPDDARLYIVNRPSGNESDSKITKMNTETGDTLFVALLTPGEGSTGYQNSFVCNNFDRYQSTVLMTINNITAQIGGDRLDIFQLYPNNEWLTIDPTEGAVTTNEQMEVHILSRAVGESENWRFGLGFYEGEIIFANDSPEGEVIIPVTMRVVEPRGIGQEEGHMPHNTKLTAYPNPFNSVVTITYAVNMASDIGISLKIFGIDGREVANLITDKTGSPGTLVDRETSQRSGSEKKQTTVWNADHQPAGIYFVRLEVGNEIQTTKILLLR